MSSNKRKNVWIKLLRQIGRAIKHSLVYRYYYKEKLQEELIFAESRNGRELAGNILRILKEIQAQYPNRYRFAVGTVKENRKRIEAILLRYGIQNATVYEERSIAYFKALFRAKYLLNDTTFPPDFVKKPGQIYLNTWHGTPYKCMGKDSAEDRIHMDNVQRNLLMSDYLLFPSHYAKEKMMEAFSLTGLYRGKLLMEGYPRNEVFFDADIATSVRTEYGLENKKIYMYLPTHRQVEGRESAKKDESQFSGFLKKMEEALSEDEILFVKMHNMMPDFGSDIVEKEARHVRMLPEDIELYEFLSCVDCLITDYSSVMYDFACTGRKTIRFIYDEKEYESSRGVYEQPTPMPFLKCHNVDDVIKGMRVEEKYNNEEFMATYCPWDGKGVANRIVSVFLQHKESNHVKEMSAREDAVILYGGDLARNGITSSLLNLLKTVDDRERFYVCYSRKLLEGKGERLHVIPRDVRLLEVTGERYTTFAEMIAYILYLKFHIRQKSVLHILDRLYQRELRKCFTGVSFKSWIDYCGYDIYFTELFLRTRGRRIIYAHSDMMAETRSKYRDNRIVLNDAYRSYDGVAVISEGLIPSVKSLGADEKRIQVVHNLCCAEEIVARSKLPIEVQEHTDVTLFGGTSLEDFFGAHQTTFVTIGRFSVEKNQKMLIDAFERIRMRHEGVSLLIIGGDGPLYEETLKRVKESRFAEDIAIVRNIDNPMALLSRCHLFILSSDYEGRPMVLMEADAVGLPIIATGSPGIVEFMHDYGGEGIVAHSVEGLMEGMEAYLSGYHKGLSLDYDMYNKECLSAFYQLLENAA